MDRQTARKISFYLRLHYPMRVTASTNGFRGSYPDLPGCMCTGQDLPTLYTALEQRRREWIAAHLQAGEDVALPNSHLTGGRAPEVRPRARRPMPLAAAASV